jgi:hypothetical protein
MEHIHVKVVRSFIKQNMLESTPSYVPEFEHIECYHSIGNLTVRHVLIKSFKAPASPKEPWNPGRVFKSNVPVVHCEDIENGLPHLFTSLPGAGLEKVFVTLVLTVWLDNTI